jgi:hypothetical protein
MGHEFFETNGVAFPRLCSGTNDILVWAPPGSAELVGQLDRRSITNISL